MEYVCFKCGRLVEIDSASRMRCNYCGGRILYKQKPKIMVSVDVN